MARLPTVTIWKGSEKRIVNQDDAPSWVAKGWSTQAPKSAKVETEEPAPAGGERRQRRGTSKTGDLPIGE
jgi:hypothetical protein